jgi:hypothetical protein
MNLDFARSQGQWGPAVVDHSIEYLQLDYIAHSNLTITAGRYSYGSQPRRDAKEKLPGVQRPSLSL